MSALRDALSRRRQDLNPLTTTIGPPLPQQFAPPTSAVSPYPYNPTAFTPISAVRSYNPQQWGSTSLSPDSTSVYTPPLQAEDGEVPPPPYSAPRNQRINAISPDEPSPALRMSPATDHRSSPIPTSAPVFPPPPGNRARAGSRDRPQPLFNLSAFTRKSTAPDQSRLSPDMHRAEQSTSSRSRPPPPIAVDLPHPVVERPLPDDSAFTARPPASRRAASAGAISTPSTSRSRGSSTARWEPGMPLPPPPPGPPPQSSSRSQSLNRTSESITSPPTRRPMTMSTLGPVPPTPAGWVDQDLASRGRSPNRGLTIDTSTATITPPPTESTSGSSSSGLSRARAVRGEPKSIRERRSESRSGKAVALEEQSNNPWAEAITPSDIMVPMTVLGRRPTITKSTPRSARSLQSADTPNSAKTAGQATPTLHMLANESRGSTPRPLNSSKRPEAPTPPFSPDQYHSGYVNESPMIPPKSLPTPPPQSRQSSEASPRPVSHLFHLPVHDVGVHPPLSPSRPSSQQSSSSQFSQPSFSQDAIKRHAVFAQKEAAASTDEERVRLFADFMVSESRLRRDRYAAAIDAMGSELLELTRDLFRPLSSSQNTFSHNRQTSRTDIRSDRGASFPSIQTDQRSESRPSSGSGAPSPNQPRPDSGYYNNTYKPSLSPIASLSMSEAPDESSSRGRPSSRWWEAGQSGPSSPSMKLERSKRESKYMGVPREVRESLQWEDGQPTPNSIASISGPSTHPAYGADEYPSEKVGWHQQVPTSPPAGPSHAHPSYSPAPPQTPKQALLDVSRLVTLPPPYPRHHPAVNNNHPDLTSIRSSVRALSNFHDIEATKSRFEANDTQTRNEAARLIATRRQNLRTNIQREIEAGSMTYADAAKLEAESTLAEAEATKTQHKTSFDLFQSSVIAPLNDLLMDRIHRTTKLFDELRSQLFVDAQQQSPNLTQEEGDEQPELLEKLTLLKWIFEAREALHRELYDLLSDRNERYALMVTEPYRLANNMAKVTNAESFFASDARKRALEAATASLGRTTELMDIVETNVVRGVEVQLSAFWDIAPELGKVLEKVPKDLSSSSGFGVVIPRDEYDENPQYERWPLQYLYSLLQHGSQSTYQFIESQINLLCLLHEVKSAVATAKGRVDDAESEVASSTAPSSAESGTTGGAEADRRERVNAMRAIEERQLTEDLKEKVRCVEELWSSGIGDEFGRVKERVRESLEKDGGWEGLSED